MSGTSVAADSRERAGGKVQPWHRDRLAAVYVRQSTAEQVADHQESTRLQYGLVERAVGLGWARSRVLVIDEDLGCSASGAQARPGFARLVFEVGLDHVGIVVGLEMSRLARSGREWHQLLELCALSGTLLADLDGVYDPAEHNDRLLLGLKGTISEAELYLIKQRMWSGRLAKARRGELAVPLPIGFVRRESGEVVLDPDEQVQAVVRLVFDLFERFGTVNAVLCFLADNGIQVGIRQRAEPGRGQVSWRRPSRAVVHNMLRNPAYAGIYVYGRSRLDPRRRQAGRPFTGRVRTERAEWTVCLPGVLPSYISVEQYERNMQRMQANQSRAASPGPVRDGPALLAGLVVCARCGARMTVRYQHGPQGRLHPAYVCARDKTDYGTGQCQQLAGDCLDTHVTGLLLAALTPAALEVSLAAADQVEQRRAQVDRIWRQRLERADYQADRARRQYQLAEPENRLVVRQLEADWEAALAERERLGEEYDRFTTARPRTLTAAERDQIRSLAADVPGIWHAPSTTDADRKQLIRQLIEQVRVAVIDTTEQVQVEIIWAGGHHTRSQIVRPVACLTQLSYYPQLAARARELVEAGHTTRQIAERLNAEGLRPPKRSATFTPNAVNDLLRALGIQRTRTPARHARPKLDDHEWWLRDLAEHLDMPEPTLDAWVRRGWATGYLHPQARLTVVRADPDEVERLRALHHVPRGQHNRRPWLTNQAAHLDNIDEKGTDGDVEQPQL
ncbi:recombinase family protein [Parafrankia elaeagni]|uniref:recombinase family protein n=1 Tax=Parafrankia elaeagni TaxID=222534 RepID=UPI0003694426|nr:recombinase family protein [Parafrankia elaeagni]